MFVKGYRPATMMADKAAYFADELQTDRELCLKKDFSY